MDVEFVRYKFEDSYDGVLTKTKFKLGVRHLQMIYMFVCSLVLGMMRGSNGIGVLAIADYTRKNETYVQIHNWDMRIQGTVLSSFLFGYALILVPAELYLKQIVDKLILTAVLLINGGLAAAMPTIVNKGGWIAVCNAQFLMGMTQACLTPVNQKLISNWLPPGEREVFGFIIQGGILLGIIISLPISGLLTESRLSWELIFYSQAMMTLSMAVIWGLLTASSPERHQAIGDTEKEFIRETLAGYKKKRLPKPWRLILQTRQFWALALARCAANATFVFFLFEIPAFLQSLQLSIRICSWQAALPFAAMWMVHVMAAPAIELVYRFGHVNYLFDVKYFRKIINGLGAFGIVIGLVILPSLVSNWNHLGIIVLIGTLGLLGLQFSGFLENYKDMTQNYPGTLLLMTSAVASVVGALVPLVCGLVIADDARNLDRWRIMFVSLAVFYVTCNAVYSVFASSDRQEWDGTGKQKFGYSNVSGWGCRHQQCLILFCCLVTALSMRACMGVALVAMVDSDVEHLANTTQEASNATDLRLLHNGNESYLKTTMNEENRTKSRVDGVLHSLLLIPPYPKFQWPKKTQDIISSSFFWGYMLLQIPGGQLAHHFGARYLLTGALLINSVLSFCVPWAAFYGGWILTVIFRIVQGLTQACLLPGVHTILGKWAPLEERGRLAGWAYGGSILGTVLGLTVTGFIASSPAGWPGIFRFYGILSGIVGSVMWIFGADTPSQHKSITVAERRYIEDRLGRDDGKKKRSVPWGKILRCRGMWAIVAAHIGQSWGQLTFYTEVPAFMDKVMGVNIKANGVLTALPYFLMWFANFFFTWCSDMLIVKKILNVANTRKLANSLGSVFPAIGLVVLAFVPKSNIYVVEIVLIVVCIFKIASNVGFHINHIDITNNYSGTLISLSNFASNLFGSQAPIVAGFLLTDVTSEYQWRKVFFVAAGFYFFSNLIYVILGEGEKAEWDSPAEDEEDEKEEAKEIEPMIKDNNVTLHDKR